MSEEEILYQIKTYDSDVADIPDGWKMSLDNGEHYGRATQVYDSTKHRYIVEYVSDNYDIHTEIQTLLQENKKLKEQLENDIDRYEDTISYQLGFEKGKEYMQQRIDKAIEYIHLHSTQRRMFVDVSDRIHNQEIQFKGRIEDLLEILGDKENE